MNFGDVRAFLSRRVAGIPVFVFVFIFAGVVLFFAIRMRNTAATDDTTDTTDEPATDGGPDDTTQQPVFIAHPIDSGDQAVTSVTQTVTPDTNDLWARRSIEWLMQNGYSVDVSTSAITKYLGNEALTAKQEEARDKAIAQFGLPPESIPDTIRKSPNDTNQVSRAPAAKQGEPPLKHIVKGKNDDTPSELARLYYGTNSQDAVNKINAANASLVGPYTVGTEVHIPANYYPHYYVSNGHTNTLYEIARKNGVTAAKIEQLNPGMKFPVDKGTRVRVR